MARSTRIRFHGAIYYVMARGNRQMSIVTDDEDCRKFIRTLGQPATRSDFYGNPCVLKDNDFISSLKLLRQI